MVKNPNSKPKSPLWLLIIMQLLPLLLEFTQAEEEKEVTKDRGMIHTKALLSNFLEYALKRHPDVRSADQESVDRR